MDKQKRRDELVFLEDISECTHKIMEYIKNISEDEFCANTEKQDAVIRRIEIIGEAVKKISIQTRNKYPKIPWREIAGMRDVVIHEYFGVSPDLVWNVATSDIPILKKQIDKIIEENPG